MKCKTSEQKTKLIQCRSDDEYKYTQSKPERIQQKLSLRNLKSLQSLAQKENLTKYGMYLTLIPITVRTMLRLGLKFDN